MISRFQNLLRDFYAVSHLFGIKGSQCYKKKGIPVVEVFQYLFLLIFSNRSMYMSLITGRNTPGFAKDTVYRFMKMLQINWIRFTTLLGSRIIRDAIVPLDSEERKNVLIIDDSLFERNVPKRWNCWQKLMTMQITDTVLASVCSRWDGQMAVPSCRSTASCSHRRIKRTGSMRLPLSINGPQGTGAGYFPCKKEPTQCWNC